MKFKFLIKTLLPLVTLAIFTTIVVAGETPQEAAIKFISIQSKRMIKGWQSAKISESVIYHDIKGDSIAYCFSILKKDQDLGYIIVSVKETDQPIQEFSTSLAPHKRVPLDQYVKKAQIYLSTEERLDEPQVVYPCPGVYLLQFPALRNDQRLKSIYIDIRSSSVIKNPPSGTIQIPSLKPKIFPQANIRYLKTVPIHQFFRSSHPLAVAEVLERFNLRKEKEPVKTFIAWLTTFMKKCLCGRPGKPIIWQVKRGVEGFSASRQNKLEVEERCRYSEVAEEKITFDDYERAIHARQPVIVTFLYDPEYRRGLGIASQRITGVSVA